METITEIQDWIQCRDQQIVSKPGQSTLLQHSSCNCGSGDITEQGVKRFQEPESRKPAVQLRLLGMAAETRPEQYQ